MCKLRCICGICLSIAFYHFTTLSPVGNFSIIYHLAVEHIILALASTSCWLMQSRKLNFSLRIFMCFVSYWLVAPPFQFCSVANFVLFTEFHFPGWNHTSRNFWYSRIHPFRKHEAGIKKGFTQWQAYSKERKISCSFLYFPQGGLRSKQSRLCSGVPKCL